MVMAPGQYRNETFMGGGFGVLGPPGCTLTCSTIVGPRRTSEQVVNFLEGASDSYGFVFGAGGGITLSNTGEVSVDYGGGLGGGATGIVDNRCVTCPTDVERQFRAGVRNIMRTLVSPVE